MLKVQIKFSEGFIAVARLGLERARTHAHEHAHTYMHSHVYTYMNIWTITYYYVRVCACLRTPMCVYKRSKKRNFAKNIRRHFKKLLFSNKENLFSEKFGQVFFPPIVLLNEKKFIVYFKSLYLKNINRTINVLIKFQKKFDFVSLVIFNRVFCYSFIL